MLVGQHCQIATVLVLIAFLASPAVAEDAENFVIGADYGIRIALQAFYCRRAGADLDCVVTETELRRERSPEQDKFFLDKMKDQDFHEDYDERTEHGTLCKPGVTDTQIIDSIEGPTGKELPEKERNVISAALRTLCDKKDRAATTAFFRELWNIHRRFCELSVGPSYSRHFVAAGKDRWVMNENNAIGACLNKNAIMTEILERTDAVFNWKLTHVEDEGEPCALNPHPSKFVYTTEVIINEGLAWPMCYHLQVRPGF